MGAYEQISERLIDRGYAAIPIMPGGKRPGFFCAGMWIGLSNWQRRGLPSEQERKNWSAQGTGVGIVTGVSSHGAVAVDIDTDDAKIKAAILSVLPPSPVRKIGKKGETLFYYGPEIEKSVSFDIKGLGRVLDLIGPGRQTVLPPSIHPDTGKPYRWLGPDTLEDLTPQELPKLAPDIVGKLAEALAPFGYKPDEPVAPPGAGGVGGDDPFRALNDAALDNLGAWVPALGLYRCRRTRRGYEAVPAWRPSSTGRQAEKRHLNLKIVPEGIRDFGADQGYTPLDLVMAANGCDLDAAFGFLSSRLGWAPVGVPAFETTGIASADTSPRTSTTDVAVANITITGAAADSGAGEQLDACTTVPGLVGDIVDWIIATARRPNRVLALGAAITIVGTLIGRRVAGPTRSATHLYVVPIASTGGGKQHILDATIRLMIAAKAGAHIGPSKFFSLSAVQALMAEKPLVLCVQDEIGVFLKSVTSRKASSHETAVSGALRSLWGNSFAIAPGAQWATRKMSLLSCPALSILGVSTPDEFYSALQGESVDNGFLNRFLALVSSQRSIDTDPQLDPGIVPPSLADALHRLYLWSGPESLLRIADPEANYVPDILPWANDQAQRCYQDFVFMVERKLEDDPESVPYLARCSEIAIRLATIRAAGRWGRGAAVDLSDMEWAAKVSWIAGQAGEERAASYLPENDRSTFVAKIASLIRRRGLMKPRDIQQFIRGRLKSVEIKDIISQLVEAGEIEWTEDGYQPVSEKGHTV